MKEVKSNFISHKHPCLFVEEDNTGLYPEGCHTYVLRECTGWDNKDQCTAFCGILTDVDSIKDVPTQSISFVQKSPDTGELVSGVTSEQLLILLMHRHAQMNAAFPSTQNEEFIKHLQSALDLLEERVKDRVSRNVMGDLKK